MESIKLAVNGTLMRGLELEKNMNEANASFLYESKTDKCYKLWSINDKNPAMVRVSHDDINAISVDVEVWNVPFEGLAKILLKEPEGLSIGKVKLINGEIVLGVIAEPELVKDMKDISSYGGWRTYIKKNNI